MTSPGEKRELTPKERMKIPRHAMREYRHCWFTSSDKTLPHTVPDASNAG